MSKSLKIFFKNVLTLKVKTWGLTLPDEGDLVRMGVYEYTERDNCIVIGGDPATLWRESVLIFREYPRKFVEALRVSMDCETVRVIMDEGAFEGWSDRLVVDICLGGKGLVFRYETERVPKVCNDFGMVEEGGWLRFPWESVLSCRAVWVLVDTAFPMGVAFVERWMWDSGLRERFSGDRKVKPYSSLIVRHLKLRDG